jgi:hypothetical protein
MKHGVTTISPMTSRKHKMGAKLHPNWQYMRDESVNENAKRRGPRHTAAFKHRATFKRMPTSILQVELTIMMFQTREE